VGAGSGAWWRSGGIAAVDALIDKADRAVGKCSVNPAGMVAAGAEHAAGGIGVAVGIVDAGRAVWTQDGVKGINLRLPVRPNRAELRLDRDSRNDCALNLRVA